jgi:hypothetical protein
MTDEPKGTGQTRWYTAAAQICHLDGTPALMPSAEETLGPAIEKCQQFQAWLRDYLAHNFVERDGSFAPDATAGAWILHSQFLAQLNPVITALREPFTLKSDPAFPIDNVSLAHLSPETHVHAKELIGTLEGMRATPMPAELVATFERRLARLVLSIPAAEPADKAKKDSAPVPEDPDEASLWAKLHNNAMRPECERMEEKQIAVEFTQGQKLLAKLRKRVERGDCLAWK